MSLYESSLGRPDKVQFLTVQLINTMCRVKWKSALHSQILRIHIILHMHSLIRALAFHWNIL